MGSYASKVAEVPERMAASQREMMLKQREMMMAMELAKAKEMLRWFGAFTGTVGVLGLAAAIKKRSPLPLIPLLPLGFVTAFHYDTVYGRKLERITADAALILQEQNARFVPPAGNRFISPEDYKKIFGITTETQK